LRRTINTSLDVDRIRVLQTGKRLAPHDDDDGNLVVIVVARDHFVHAAERCGVTPMAQECRVVFIPGECG
jgi:hypothetical protein